MKPIDSERFRDTVYVVGAGFSAGLGYPLTKSLLIDVWDLLPKTSRSRLAKIIRFHHPSFDPARKTSFPDIEQLLTEIKVNLDLFSASRLVEGSFKKNELEDARDELLCTIAGWFHDLYENASRTPWLTRFTERLQFQNAGIISFNWDLILDQLLFAKEPTEKGY